MQSDALTNPLIEDDTVKRLATATLIGSGVAVIVGALLVRLGVANRNAAQNAQPQSATAGASGMAMSNAGEVAIFGGTLVAVASIGAMIGVKANGWGGAVIGAGLATFLAGLPAAIIATMILARDTGSGPQ